MPSFNGRLNVSLTFGYADTELKAGSLGVHHSVLCFSSVITGMGSIGKDWALEHCILTPL
ncbi:hypothetical protein GCM10023333_20350 [Ferrimonas pelagia]|uniref:Uncharacterized protein n=1 Tax=Ferrimonas pelagia TaxID=1177826 RepID=A0ABP9F0A3_9GAMM